MNEAVVFCQLFIQTYEIVTHLTAKEFEAIAGIKQRVLLQQLHALRQQMLHPVIPLVMKTTPHVTASRQQSGQYIVITEKGLYQIPSIVYGALKYFDGVRKNAEAIRLFEQDHNASIEKDLLGYLYQSRILVGS